jgi:D-alanyl-D-alanine carboxypeptidase (penicillin-binding protein 5/6)
MSKELLNKHPDIKKYTTIWMDSLRDGKSQLVNTNKMIRNYEGATGLKTGSTSLALYNLSASATRNGLDLIAVIMKAPTTDVRFKEATALLNYGFANCEYKEFGKANEVVQSVSVEKGLKTSIDVMLKQDIGAVITKGDSKNITTEFNVSDKITAPVSEGAKIGEVVVKNAGTVIATSDLVTCESVKKVSYLNNSSSLILDWFNLFR